MTKTRDAQAARAKRRDAKPFLSPRWDKAPAFALLFYAVVWCALMLGFVSQ
jgi:hypothetical protein